MKKILACVLALTMVLAMGINAFAATAAPALAVTAEKTDAGKIIVTITIPANSYLTNAAWDLTFDSAVVSYNKAASDAQKEDVEAIGTYGSTEDGIVGIGYMIDTRLTKAKTVAVCVFDITDADAASASFTFKTKELKVVDADDTDGANSYAPATMPTDVVKTVAIKAPVVIDSETEGLLAQIEDLFNKGGKVDTTDTGIKGLLEAFSNADIDTILDKIGANDLGGLDLDAVKGYLNKIIDMLKGTTTSGGGAVPVVTTEKVPSKSTTKGSGEGLGKTGDAGVALAATVCLAAAAAFVMSRKKKED